MYQVWDKDIQTPHFIDPSHATLNPAGLPPSAPPPAPISPNPGIPRYSEMSAIVTNE